MSSGLRKALSLGPAGIYTADSIQAYRDGGSRFWVYDTGTPWVRLWARWDLLQPTPGTPLQGTGAPGDPWLALDEQVRNANTDGKYVMIVVWRCPTWANGTDGNTPGIDPEFGRLKEDGKFKDYEFRIPVNPDWLGPWSMFLVWLMYRYHPLNSYRQGVAHAIEICNEPNFQMYPQRDQNGVPMHVPVARMFRAAQAARNYLVAPGHGPILLGPGTSDTDRNSTAVTPYSTFTEGVLNELATANFYPDTEFGWSHHNYIDIEYDQGGAAPSTSDSSTGRYTNRARDVSNRLATGRGANFAWRWAGWPRADAADPQVFLTEGGARRQALQSLMNQGVYPGADLGNKQAQLLRRNYDRMANGSDGSNVTMLTWYTVAGDPVPDNDCGLREPTTPYNDRPPYWDWKSTVQAGNLGLDHWHGWEDLGGPVLGGFDASSWGAGRLDVFVRGVDTGVYHTWFDGGWHSWEYLNGTTNADPTAVSWGSRRIDLFVRDAGNNQCLHRWFDGSWSALPWEALGGTFYSGLDACSWGPGRLDIFGLGTDYNLWHKWYDRGWGPSQLTWEPLGGVGAAFTSDPGAVSWGSGRLDVFVRGPSPSYDLYHKYWSGSSWSGWESLGSGPMDTAPDVCSWGPGRLDVFWIRDGQLMHKWYDNGWHGIERIGANVNSNPGAASWGVGRVDVFARSASGSCSHTWYE